MSILPLKLTRGTFGKLIATSMLLFTVFAPLIVPSLASAQSFEPPPGSLQGGTFTPSASVSTGPNGPVADSSIVSCKLDDPVGCIESVFYFLFVQITAFFASIAGLFFDFATATSIDGGIYSSKFISDAWTISRDLANMAFVFLLIYLAFTLILNIAHSGVGKSLAKIIAVALLINFSFFFTRVVIDASNILSHAFYDNIRGRDLTTNGSSASAGGRPIAVKSISEGVLAGINPQQLLSDSNNSFKAYISQVRESKVAGRTGKLALLVGIFIAFGVINILLIFIFFAAAIQMIGRIVRLWLVIMLAPLGFVAWIIPGLGSLSKRWWDTLLQNAFFAPAFMLGLYIIITLVSSGGLLSGISSSFGNPQNATSITVIAQGIIVVFLRLAIVIGLLFAALKIGDYFGQTSSKVILNTAQKYTGMPSFSKMGGAAYSWTGGAAARALDSGIKNSRLGNTLVGYKMRQYTTQPLAKATPGGAESAAARADRLKKEKGERDGKNRDLDNKDVLTKVKEAKTPAAYAALPQKLKDDAKAIINNANKRELEAMGAATLISLAHLQDGSTVKRVGEIESFSEQQRSTNKEAWASGRTEHGKLGSSDASINKIDSYTKSLERSVSSLTPADHRSLSNTMALLSSDTKVNKDKIDRSKNEVTSRLASLTAQNETAEKREDAEQTLITNTYNQAIATLDADVRANRTTQAQADVEKDRVQNEFRRQSDQLSNTKISRKVQFSTQKRNYDSIIDHVTAIEKERPSIATDVGKHPTGTLSNGETAQSTNAGEYYVHANAVAPVIPPPPPPPNNLLPNNPPTNRSAIPPIP